MFLWLSPQLAVALLLLVMIVPTTAVLNNCHAVEFLHAKILASQDAVASAITSFASLFHGSLCEK
jgi:hypothetical protein